MRTTLKAMTRTAALLAAAACNNSGQRGLDVSPKQGPAVQGTPLPGQAPTPAPVAPVASPGKPVATKDQNSGDANPDTTVPAATVTLRLSCSALVDSARGSGTDCTAMDKASGARANFAKLATGIQWSVDATATGKTLATQVTPLANAAGAAHVHFVFLGMSSTTILPLDAKIIVRLTSEPINGQRVIPLEVRFPLDQALGPNATASGTPGSAGAGTSTGTAATAGTATTAATAGTGTDPTVAGNGAPGPDMRIKMGDYTGAAGVDSSRYQVNIAFPTVDRSEIQGLTLQRSAIMVSSPKVLPSGASGKAVELPPQQMNFQFDYKGQHCVLPLEVDGGHPNDNDFQPQCTGN